MKTELLTMILAVAATEFEMVPFLGAIQDNDFCHLVCGVGPVESCLRLTRFLENSGNRISAVVNFGVGGLFPQQGGGAELLGMCLASTETLGDLGICYPLRIDDLPEGLPLKKQFVLDRGLLQQAGSILLDQNICYSMGNFVTVSCASGTRGRGEMLRECYEGLCENMEGASLARVCSEFSLPFLEIRCISNHVEDRDPSRWRLKEACSRAGKTAAILVAALGNTNEHA